MRSLYYTNYQSGVSGLSNGIMSIEIGVILAHLTNRLLVLDGNISPPANLVTYDSRVNNEVGSRVTDLVEIPVPWIEASKVDLSELESAELTRLDYWDFAFYFPKTLDVSSHDARAFARDRTQWVTVTGEHDRVPVLRLSEEPLTPDPVTGRARNRRANLGFYSYQFYLDQATRRSVYRLLERMQAKKPYAELAARVARDLHSFNAVHFRRGDFKVTYGVTTLDRKPSEAIEAMAPLFSRKEPLVILTDEREDPFFREIKLAYPEHLFIDWHILDHYGAEFAKLERTDSLSLAYLSQLVAAESKEFLGTMTSTFTALIQRYRGNRGKREVFRYLWNELPDSGAKFERGRHAISECIPLDCGRMVDLFQGPYSWNRVSQELNPAWMREWPESFLLPEVLQTGSLVKEKETVTYPTSHESSGFIKEPVLYVGFENLQVAIRCEDGALFKRLGTELGADPATRARNVIAHFDITQGASYGITQRGHAKGTFCDKNELPIELKRQIATLLAGVRHNYSWLTSAAFAKDGRGLVIAGDVDDANDQFVCLLEARGWRSIDRKLVAIRADDLMVIPFGAQTQGEASAPQVRFAVPLDRLVIAKKAPLYARDTRILPMSPAHGVAALVGLSLDFSVERDRAVEKLCRLIEQRPAALLHCSRPDEAAEVISRFAHAGWEGIE